MSQLPNTPTSTITKSSENESGMAQIVAKTVQPGWQTSEFWQSIMATAVGLALLSYGVIKDKDVAVQWGAGLTGMSVGAYTIGRSLLKK